jgi:hypothetical protein
MLQQEHHYKNLRPVKYKGYYDWNGTWIPGNEASIGRFHGWGTANVRNEKITVALVEDQTGQMRTIEPEDLVFTDTDHHIADDNELFAALNAK